MQISNSHSDSDVLFIGLKSIQSAKLLKFVEIDGFLSRFVAENHRFLPIFQDFSHFVVKIVCVSCFFRWNSVSLHTDNKLFENMHTWKQNMEDTKAHYLRWWRHEGLVLNMWEHFQQDVVPHADIPAPPPPKDNRQKWFDPQWRARFLDWYVAHSSLMADMLPVANTQLGPGSLAAILGGVFEGAEDTIWIHPDPHFKDDIKWDRQHPNWLLHKELLKECKRLSQGHYYVGMPDLMEGLDVLAALKGTNQVLLDTVMQPEVLEHQMQQINDIYFQVFDELYDIIREGDEMAFCYFSLWAPGKVTKLQSDISTMISTDDYRRFVQPFIAEQCRRIDYTLYHLDGVGAMHHLPALLEIEELDAIQWTPGVGQPQGGSPKWYGLYRQILEAGKSVMACWVTLDELRPLLDHIGGKGVHIEMDFHHEREVEQALRIVEEYQVSAPAVKNDEVVRVQSVARPSLETLSAQRVLVLDGGMGTMIQRYGLKEQDFRGEQFASHLTPLKGCNDLLSVTRPDVVADIHQKYLAAGATLIETNTFNAQRVSMGDYGLAAYCREINLAACRIATEMAQRFSTPEAPRYVVGSVGPTSRISSFATGNSLPLRIDELEDAYEEQMDALLDGGVDAILIETIFDTRNALAALDACRRAMERKGRRLPIMLSFSISTPDGKNMLGQSILDFLDSLDLSDIFSVGINCLTDVKVMIPLIETLGSRYGRRVSLYPNAGMPDAGGSYSLTPDDLQADVWPLLDHHRLNILGGCCGTTDSFIAAFAHLVQPAPGLFLSPFQPVKSQPQAPASSVTTVSSDEGESDAPADHPLYTAVYQGDESAAVESVRTALREGADPQSLINGEMIRAMGDLGQAFEEGKAFVPQLLLAGRAMKAAMNQLAPVMSGGNAPAMGRVVIGTVKGDLHDIGKNLVASMLEGCGFEVVNVGIDVSADTFVEEVRRHRPDILCMSALLTTTMGYMREVIDALEKAGLRRQVKIMIGGAPVSQRFADEIGADGYSDNANSAVALAKALMAQ